MNVGWRILLTGGTGFLGSALREAFRESAVAGGGRDETGHDGVGAVEVISLGRSVGNDIRVDLAAGVPDLSSWGSWNVVVHAAGMAHVSVKSDREAREMLAVNVQGTRHLLKALEGSGVGRLVFISTTAVYGDGEGRELDERSPLLAKQTYPRSKIEAEVIVSEWCARHSVVGLILRLPLVVGEGARGNFGRMVEGIRTGRYIRIGAGEARIGMVMARDVGGLVADWSLREWTTGNVGVYNLSDGRHPSYAELDRAISMRMGRRVRAIPRWTARLLGEIGQWVPGFPVDRALVRKLTTTRTFSDARARRDLGWRPNSVLDSIDELAGPRQVLVVSELYHPELTSTGYFVTGIAEGLAARPGLNVSVVCSQPTYALLGVKAPEREVRNGVEIIRVRGNKGHKDRLGVKIRAMAFFVGVFGAALWRRIRPGQVVIILTNPPTLPFLAGWLARRRGARSVLLLHDLFPDIAVPGDVIREDSALYRILDRLQASMMRRMDRLVVLGRDARVRVSHKVGWDPEGSISSSRISVIPNWGDPKRILPRDQQPNPLRERLEREGFLGTTGDATAEVLVQYSGNIGRTSGVHDFLDLVKRMRDRPDVRFMVFGKGASHPWLKQRQQDLGLDNLFVTGPCSDGELGTYLTAADVALIVQKPGMHGISVPSRIYNMMAAGVPVLAVVDAGSEVAQLVRETGMGWVARAGDPDSVEAVMREALDVPAERRREMGLRGRARMERDFTRDRVVRDFEELIRGLA